MTDFTMSGLVGDGYCGSDDSLEVSLREYGLAWYTEDDEHFSFLYGSPHDYDEEYGYRRFYTVDLQARDFFSDYSWADFYAVALMTGDTVGDWLQRSYPRRVDALIQYYGCESVFGSEYFEGFEIEDDE